MDTQRAFDWLNDSTHPLTRHRLMAEFPARFGEEERRQAAQAAIAALPQAQVAGASSVRSTRPAGDLGWMTGTKGLWLTYHLSALAECALTRELFDAEPAVRRLLDQPMDCGCGDALALRALVMLGWGCDPEVRARLDAFCAHQRPDGGWFCLHRLQKRHAPAKSCYRDALHGLLLAGECAKRQIPFAGAAGVADYFLRRNLFYRSDDPTQPVLDMRPGWRIQDTFYPFEVMRVGVQNVVESLCALGHGGHPALKEAWTLLETHTDEQGRLVLDGTLQRSWLPKEAVGKSSRWVTLYALLAKAEREQISS